MKTLRSPRSIAEQRVQGAEPAGEALSLRRKTWTSLTSL
jgi:hypothetical protein